MINMSAHTKGRIPDSLRQTFVQGYQVLSQLPVNPQVPWMDLATDQLTSRSIVRQGTAIDGISIVEPEIIHMQVVKSGHIFPAAGSNCARCILAESQIGRASCRERV